MKSRIAAVVAAALIGVAAPVSSAMAFYAWGDQTTRGAPVAPYASQERVPLGVHDGTMFTACPASSAAEGNARQQNFPVKQYGQTSGGPLC